MTTSQRDSTDVPQVLTPLELGNLVRQARLNAGLTQAELAEDAEVGRQWLVGFEAGDKETAPLAMVWRLLDVLDLTVIMAPPPAPPSTHNTQPIITASEILALHTISGPEALGQIGAQ
jgi:transcriptional regulator with XRE-family HTH domain